MLLFNEVELLKLKTVLVGSIFYYFDRFWYTFQISINDILDFNGHQDLSQRMLTLQSIIRQCFCSWWWSSWYWGKPKIRHLILRIFLTGRLGC